MKKTVLLLALSLISILTPGKLFSQWESHGPYGGAMTALCEKNNVIFAGTMVNGVFKSSDYGLTWTSANNGLSQKWITDLKAGSSGIFAGTSGNGVYFSSDNGNTWTSRNNGISDPHITSLFTMGNETFAGTPAGIYYSNNNGVSWTLRNNGIPFTYDIYSWASMGDTLYAGTYGQGLFKSVNNGMSWTQVGSGFPTPQPMNTGPYVYAMATSGNTIFAGTNVGIYLTTNRGQSWFYSGNQFMTNNQALSLAVINGTLFAGTYGEGIYYSNDNAVSFIQANNGLQWFPDYPYYLEATEFVGNSSYILAGTWFGMYRSTNNAQLWTDSNQGILATDVTGVASNGNVTYAGTNFTGLYASTDKGQSWQRRNNGLQANNVLAVVTKGQYGFASIMNKRVSRSSDNGQSWQYASNGLPADIIRFAADTDRVLGITAAGKYTPNKLYQTVDNGMNWTEVPTTPAGGGMTAVAVRAPYFYLGTSQGTLLRSSNGGIGWADISYYLPMASITAILPLDTVTFVGTSGKGIFMFLDNDSHMRTSVIGLTNYYITDLIYQDGVLFASTNGGGVFISTNMGNTWMEFNTGLDNMVVRELAGDSLKVYAATGAGVYNTDENAFKLISILAGVKEEQLHNNISFYPNPSKELVYIQSTGGNAPQVDLYDLKGQHVKNYPAPDAMNSINLHGLQSGVYVMKITTAEGSSIRKLIIE